MYVAALGTAVPAHRYSQKECWEAFRLSAAFARLGGPARVLLERVLLADNGIRTRHLALERLSDAFELDPDVLDARFRAHAPTLAERAARVALDRAALEPADIDALLVSTCTGYLCPGLTSYVGERLGLRADVCALDLVGQGCGAALPNLRAAEALIASRGCSRVLSICVEVCSAALYIDNDPGVLVSACLFGDGAAAALLSDAPAPGMRRVAWLAGFSRASPADREALRMERRGGLLRNILAPSVPAVAARHASQLFNKSIAARGLKFEDIRGWILHAGGRTVLDRLRESLEVGESDLRLSREALARFGNLSSPFVLFVLDAALRASTRGGWWWMATFGAGFSSHGALLQVD